MKNKSAFTLVELLVTMVIMVILMSISLFALNSARVAARDSRRVADLQAVSTALELYKADCGRYPNSIFFSSGGVFQANCIGPYVTYLPSLPSDPQSSSSPSKSYIYSSSSSDTYKICAALEQAPSPAMNTSGCSYCVGGNISSCNYAITNIN